MQNTEKTSKKVDNVNTKLGVVISNIPTDFSVGRDVVTLADSIDESQSKIVNKL